MRILTTMTLLCGLTVSQLTEAEPDTPRPQDQQNDEQMRRSRLWKSLLDACPEKYRKVTVYAENDALTVVCFRSGRTTLMFSTKNGRVEVVQHMKALPSVNRITHRKNERGPGTFLLWYYGKVELTTSCPE
jgi:hypothetical protein